MKSKPKNKTTTAYSHLYFSKYGYSYHGDLVLVTKFANAKLRNANFRRNARADRVKPSLHTKD